MKPVRAASGPARFWLIVGLIGLIALDAGLVCAAFMHGRPDVHGSPGPVATYSSQAAPVVPAVGSPSSPDSVAGPSPTGTKRQG